MYSRRSIEQSQSSGLVQTVQFSSFRRKGLSENAFSLSKVQGKQNEFKISNASNFLIDIIVISSFLNPNLPKKLRSQENSTFQGMLGLENVPRQFITYQHEKTLEQLWAKTKSKVSTVEDIEELMNNYPIAEFLIQCFGRKIMKDYIDENMGLGLLGNEDELLSDYSAEIRGDLLGYLAEDLKVEVTIHHEDFQKPDQPFKEVIGSADALWKVFVYSEDDGYRFQILEEEQTPQLLSISSSSNIYSSYQNKKKSSNNTESDAMQTTADGQSYNRSQAESKSVNKDMYRCRACGSKVKFCDCEIKKKIIKPQKGRQPETPGRTIFDGMGFERIGARRGSRQQNSAKLCFKCNRLMCACKK